jgi:hypothetical protein
MNEVTNTFNFDQASWEDLRNEAKRLNSALESMNNKMRYVEVALANRERQRSVAAEICERLIKDGSISEDEDISALVEALGLEITREVAFTITVEISGTLELPYGEELDEYAFDVDSVTYNGDSVDVSDNRVENLEWDEV